MADVIKTTAVLNLPWVEKYRPSSLDELISHEEIISTIQRFIKEEQLPHLLFYGPPGTGKTSMIKAIATLLYGPKYKSMVLELNASDDRGIGVVRDKIKEFASTRTIFNSGFKLVILDEADAMTTDAQNALRRIIEKYTRNTRFCIICNYVSKIITALQSRCTRFRFAPLKGPQVREQLQRVIASEELTITDDGMKALEKLAFGDMRKALNILQCTSMAHDVVDEKSVYSSTGHPDPADITTICSTALNQPYIEAYKEIMELKTTKGLAMQDILSEVHEMLEGYTLPVHARVILLEQLAVIEERLVAGTSEKIQLGAFLAIFQRIKPIVHAAAQ